MTYRVKLGFFFASAVAVLLLSNTIYQALNTLSQLNVVEADRDQWQRPSEVLRALDLRPGDAVLDLGCGSGYFTLKLSPQVGNSGRVIAEDIRWLPLVFLWVRAAQRRDHNVRVIHGDPEDPHLHQPLNAVLIANTYHEFTDARPILAHVYESLVSGGRLVVVDREPQPSAEIRGEIAAGHHEISADKVQGELIRAGFAMSSREDGFIQNDPLSEKWWLIVARKP